MPEELKKAFKATLEEMVDADILLHMVDISSPLFEKHIETVDKLLDEIGLARIPRVLVFNKIDLEEPEIVRNLSLRFDAVPISAPDPATFENLLKVLQEKLWPGEVEEKEVVGKG
jgi:GTP-binding protein HflX